MFVNFFISELQKTIAILSRDKHYSHPTGPQQLTADELNQVYS